MPQREAREKIDLEPWVKDLRGAISARIHIEREKIIWRVLCPLLVAAVVISLLILVCAAFGWIHPSDAVMAITGAILGANVLGFVLTAGFGWLFRSGS